MAQSYSNIGGTGNRTTTATPTTTATLGGGSISALVEGTQANSLWFNAGQSGREVKFDFGQSRLITEATWYQDSAAAHGTWQWQGSPDNSTWTSIGTTFTLGSSATQVITTLSGNVTSYRYYRMLQATGTTNSGPYLREIEFSIDDTLPAYPSSSTTYWNVADRTTAVVSLSANGLTATVGANSSGGVRARGHRASGKYYVEYTVTPSPSSSTLCGFATAAASLLGGGGGTGAAGQICVATGGQIYIETSLMVNIGAMTDSVGNLICVALDLDNRQIWFRRTAAGNWNNSGTANPATNTGGFAIPGTVDFYPWAWASTFSSGTQTITGNFAGSFAGAVPSGFTSGFSEITVTDARVTQAFAEHWLTTNPQAQVTQVVAEHWASVASGNLQAVVTFVALEHWTSVAVVVPAAGGPMVTMIH